MTRTQRILTAALAVLLVTPMVMLAQARAEVALKAAIETEIVKGDVKTAIEQYKRLAAGSDRPVAVQAELRLGRLSERLGQHNEARQTYERIVQRYADQTDVAADARRRLAALDGARQSDPLTVRHVYTTRSFESPSSITPDGELMGIDGGDIGVRDTATGKLTWLVTDGSSLDVEAECSIISPDKQHVAYAWYARNEKREMRGELRIVENKPDSPPRILIPGNPEFTYVDPIAWAPDGQSILITINRRDKTWQIGRVALADGKITVLKSLGWRLEGAPSLSPDGRYVAYSALVSAPARLPSNAAFAPIDATGEHIYALASDGSSESDLTPGIAGVNADPIWTPDGTHILFISDRYGTQDLWSTPVQAGKPAGAPSLVRREIGGGTVLGMTQSGSYYYSKGQGDIQHVPIVEMEPGGRRAKGPAVHVVETLIGKHPTWSPDGRRVAFLRTRSTSTGRLVESRIVRVIETGEEQVFDRQEIVNGAAPWFSDSTSYLEMVRENGERKSYRVDVRSGRWTPVLTNVSAPYNLRLGPLSRDDKELFVTDFGAARLLALDITGGQEREVFKVTGGARIENTAMSPNGRVLALAIRDSNNRLVIARIAVDGSGYRELHVASGIDADYVTNVAWTTGDRGILFSLKSSPPTLRRIMLVPADGGVAESTGIDEESAGFRGGPFSLSSDGTRLAFSTQPLRGVREVWALDNVMSALKTTR